MMRTSSSDTLWCDAELDELVFVCANKHVKKQNHFNSIWCSQIDIIIRHLNICFSGEFVRRSGNGNASSWAIGSGEVGRRSAIGEVKCSLKSV